MRKKKDFSQYWPLSLYTGRLAYFITNRGLKYNPESLEPKITSIGKIFTTRAIAGPGKEVKEMNISYVKSIIAGREDLKVAIGGRRGGAELPIKVISETLADDEGIRILVAKIDYERMDSLARIHIKSLEETFLIFVLYENTWSREEKTRKANVTFDVVIDGTSLNSEERCDVMELGSEALSAVIEKCLPGTQVEEVVGLVRSKEEAKDEKSASILLSDTDTDV